MFLKALSLVQNTDPFVNSPLVESSLTLSLFIEQDAIIVICSVVDAIDYLYHGIIIKYAFLSLSHSPPLRTSSTITMTLTVTVTLSTLACESSILFAYSLLIFSQRKTPLFSQQTTYLL